MKTTNPTVHRQARSHTKTSHTRTNIQSKHYKLHLAMFACQTAIPPSLPPSHVLRGNLFIFSVDRFVLFL